MFNRYIATILALLFSITLSAQGINFEKGTWKEAVEKAKKENKLIYLDVYAEWCGPCKMMAKNVFPDPKAGEKYNAEFINVKIDAEKGEGRNVARQYGVSSYPTNLYINPHTEKAVYRIAGACGVEEFIKRADIALHDFNDPMTWAQYQSQLKSSPKDLKFLETYISKAQRIGENYDHAIDIYVKHHMSTPATDSQLIFLLNHVQNMDNQGYVMLAKYRERADDMVREAKYKLEEREKSSLLNNTFKKALEKKDLSVMNSTKPILFKYNSFDSLGKWYSIENIFYQNINDEKNQLKSIQNAINYYEKLGQNKLTDLNQKAFEENRNQLKSSGRYVSMTEEQFNKEIINQVKKNPSFKYPLTLGQINSYINGAQYYLNSKKPTKKELSTTLTWLNNAQNIVPEENIEYLDKIYEMKAICHYKMNDKTAAIDITNERIKFLKGKNQPVKNAEDILAKINNNTLLSEDKK